MKILWVDKYRPKTLADYVFKDQNQRKKVESWIQSGALGHLLLSGSPGTGKTSLAKMLMAELNVDPFDVLEVNASKNNGVDFIRETITRFSETMGYGEFKYVILDESDYLSPSAQAVLRNTMERYSGSVRFILTCNYPHKIIPALQSRTESGRMHIDRLDRDEYTLRLCNILISESVDFDMEVVDVIVNKCYPDMRRGISMMQSNTIDNKLSLPDEDVEAVSDFRIDMIALFKSGKFREARQLICKQIKPEEYEDMYRFMYQNLEIWGSTLAQQDQCVLEIKQGLVDHTVCADPEINLSACLIRLEMISMGVE